MGELYLSGGGNAGQSIIINKSFAERINKHKPILYIPLAGDPRVRSYEMSFKYIKSIFNPLGIENIDMWSDVKYKTIDDIKNYSAIYIGGGNTYNLLRDLRNSAFDKVLLQYYSMDGIIYGQSAGSIIFGESINHTYIDKDQLKSIEALNIIKGYSLWCHYNEEDDDLIKEYSKSQKHPYISIPEGTAIHYKEKDISFIGTNPAYVIDGESKREICH